MRNEVPPLISRPSRIFLVGGQKLQTLKITSTVTSAIASKRFRRPWSVAKYHPKRTSSPIPRKNSTREFILTFHRFRLRHRADGRLLHFQLHVVGHLHRHRCLLDVRNDSMNPSRGHDAVAGFESADEPLLLFLPPHLRAQKNKIHNDKNENDGDE